MTTSSRTPSRIKALLGLRTDQLSMHELLELVHWHQDQAVLLHEHFRDQFLAKSPIHK